MTRPTVETVAGWAVVTISAVLAAYAAAAFVRAIAGGLG